MNYIQQLKAKLDTEQLWERQLTLERNQFLKVSGNIDTNLYYVLEGSLRVFTISEYEEHTFRFGYQGNFIAALDSFMTGQPSKFYIQALKQTQLQVISRSAYNQFLNSSSANLQLWNNILSFLVVEQMEREQDILINSPIERYKRVLKRSPQLFQEVPNKYIASYLRMSPETLSRIKKS